MIGLTDLQADVYEAACAYEREFDVEPFLIDIQQALNISLHEAKTRAHRCIERGFLCFDDDGRIIINEPPHERAMRLVCAEACVSESDIIGPLQTLRLTAARRSIAHRLNAVGYGYSDIGRVVNRHQSTVMGYFELPRPRGGRRVKTEAAQCTA